MSSNKKFRIQNGVDITGQLIVGGRLVIDADGTIAVSTLEGAVTTAFAAEVTTLQTQIDALLEASPESLDTLQEIVALFQSEDNDLSTLISQNAAAIAALQAQIVSKTNTSEVDALTTSMTGVQSLLAVEETTTSGELIYARGTKVESNPDGAGTSVYGLDVNTGNLLFTLDGESVYTTVAENDSYIVFGNPNTDPNAFTTTPHWRAGYVNIYEKDSNGYPTLNEYGNPAFTLTSPPSVGYASYPLSPVGNNPYFGGNSDGYPDGGVELVGDYLFVCEPWYNSFAGISDQPDVGRVCVYDATNDFQFLFYFKSALGDGSKLYNVGNGVIKSGTKAILVDSNARCLVVDTSNDWEVRTPSIQDTSLNLNSYYGYWVDHPSVAGWPNGYEGTRIYANNQNIIFYSRASGSGDLIAVVWHSGQLHTSLTLPANISGSNNKISVSDDYLVIQRTDSVTIYSLPDLSYVGTITKDAGQFDWAGVSVRGSKISISSANDKCLYVYDISSSLTAPVTVIDSPDATDDYFGYYSVLSSIDGVTTTAFPTLETTSTTVVGAINELNATFSSLSGGTCIDYNASTGVISVDEADAAANLHVATSSDTNSLDGQDGDYYRLDVYDANDTIIN